MAKEYDLVVLGGGTGGYVGAIRAAQLGMTVAIVEMNKLGGTCLHKGCIPSKALLKSAEMYRLIQEADKYGIITEQPKINFSQMQLRKDDVVNQLHQGIQLLMKKNNIDVYEGKGTILGASIFSPIPGTISVDHQNGKENTMLIPKNVLIATGSTPRHLKDSPCDGQYILHSDHILQLEELPQSMTIIGGGVIGIEWASLLTDLGVEVTVIEFASDILMAEDKEVRQLLKKSLSKRHVTFYTDAAVEKIEKNDDDVTVIFTHKEKECSVTSTKALVSVGRLPNINSLGLTNTSIEVENETIKTNEFYQTEESHIYAIGDCIGGLQLAHVASQEAIIAVEHMNQQNPEPLNNESIPSCIYAYPEASKIGLTEEQAIEQGYAISVGKFPYQGIGKSHVNGDVQGFCKIIVDEKTDDIIGIHIAGESATELINEASLAKYVDASGWELSQTIHAHPSLSEVFAEAALAAKNIQIHG